MFLLKPIFQVKFGDHFEDNKQVYWKWATLSNVVQ